MSVKEKTLAALLEAPADVSGEWLARKLGVSRNCVWKAIAQLREEGYVIQAVTNRGYRLVNPDEVVSTEVIARYLRTREFGRTLEVHKEIDSTNNRAKQLAQQGAPHGTLCVSCAQTGGKGRFGRRFFSPEGMGIYFTLLLRPQLTAEKAVMLTSMAAVATARAIESLAQIDVQIKWVNDLYADGRKLCGILTEAGMDFESGCLEYAAVGIGVNVQPCTFPEELKEIATSVGNVCGHRLSRARLVAEVCNQFELLYPDLETGAFMEESRKRSCVIGHDVLVLRGDERYSAAAIDIDEEGSLVVRTEDGEIRHVHSGEISIRIQR